jgi:hypothetical protein
MACKKGSSLNRTQIMAAASSESVENIGKPDGDENSFTVGRVRCQHQLFFGQRSSVYYGFWKEDGKTETEVVVKKIPQNHCTEKWEKAIAKHENKTINHDNILKMFGFEDEVVDQWRSVVFTEIKNVENKSSKIY